MTATDALRELAKIAKSQGNRRMVWIYFENFRMQRKRRCCLGNSNAR